MHTAARGYTQIPDHNCTKILSVIYRKNPGAVRRIGLERGGLGS